MTDSKNAQDHLREIIRHTFEFALDSAGDDRSVVNALQVLVDTASQIDCALLDAYGELFEDVRAFEVEQEILWRVGRGWWPESASAFISI